MITLKKQSHKFPDLFEQERSATKRLSILLSPEYHNNSIEQLIEKGIEILNLEDTVISDSKKKEYIDNFKKQKSKIQFQYYITNIVFKGSNMSMSSL